MIINMVWSSNLKEKVFFRRFFDPQIFWNFFDFFWPKFDPNLNFLTVQTTFFKCFEHPKCPNNPEITVKNPSEGLKGPKKAKFGPKMAQNGRKIDIFKKIECGTSQLSKKNFFFIFSADSCGNEGLANVLCAIRPIFDIMKEPNVRFPKKQLLSGYKTIFLNYCENGRTRSFGKKCHFCQNFVKKCHLRHQSWGLTLFLDTLIWTLS